MDAAQLVANRRSPFMTPQDACAAMLRVHLPEPLLSPVFLFLGARACSIAAIRHCREFRVLLWFGLFVGMYGTRLLAAAATALGLAGGSPIPQRIGVFIDCFLVVPGTLFWVDLSVANLQRLLQVLAAFSAGIGTPAAEQRSFLFAAVMNRGTRSYHNVLRPFALPNLPSTSGIID